MKKRRVFTIMAMAGTLALGGGLAGCGNSSDSPAIGPNPPDNPTLEAQLRDGYVGSAACIQCHKGKYDGWAQTAHGDMIQVANEETIVPGALAILKDALENPNQALSAGTAVKAHSSIHDIANGTKKGLLAYGGNATTVPDVRYIESLDEIKYVVGGKWKQRFVVQTENGHVFLRWQFYDSPATPGGAPDPRAHEYGPGRVYEDRCLDCHSTGFSLELANSLDRTAPDYSLGRIVTELGIGCEKCHGPGESHVNSRLAADILNPADFTVNQQTAFCGSCHGRNASHTEWTNPPREDAIGFNLGDSSDDLHALVRMLDPTDPENGNLAHNPGVGYFAGSNQRFHDDGASRSHRQQYNDMLQGPHAGILSCTDCHDVHRGNALKASTTVSLCASCHDGTIAPGRMFTQADIDAIMPKRAQSTNRPDIATHTFLYGGVGKPSPDMPRNAAGEATFDNAEFVAKNADYLGTQMCLMCHSDKSGWSNTAHGDMIQVASSDTIRPVALEMLQTALTSPATPLTATSGNWGDNATYGDLLKYGPHSISGNEGSISSLDEIKYVVGGKWKQRYVLRTDDGHVFLNWQFYDSPDGTNPRAHTYGEFRSYEDRCLACHSTGFDVDAIPPLAERATNNYRLEDLASELGVGCESCHGPGSLHIEMLTGNGQIGNIINPKRFKSHEQFDACGSCHARNDGSKHFAGRNDAPGFLIGDDLEDHVTVTRWPNEARFHDDGAGFSHRMQYNDMEQGPKAGMNCSTCHDVHNDNALRMESFDALCASCHGPGHGYDIDKVMPLRSRSTNVPDIRTHTFIIGTDGIAVGNQEP